MTSSKYHVLQFKTTPFEFQDVVNVTGLSPRSIRNMLSELVNEGLISADVGKDDRRKRFYSLNWRYIVEKLKHAALESEEMIQMLELEEWDGKHVVLKNFQVIDSDNSLQKLVLRFWDRLPDPDIVILTIGLPRDVCTVDY